MRKIFLFFLSASAIFSSSQLFAQDNNECLAAQSAYDALVITRDGRLTWQPPGPVADLNIALLAALARLNQCINNHSQECQQTELERCEERNRFFDQYDDVVQEANRLSERRRIVTSAISDTTVKIGVSATGIIGGVGTTIIGCPVGTIITVGTGGLGFPALAACVAGPTVAIGGVVGTGYFSYRLWSLRRELGDIETNLQNYENALRKIDLELESALTESECAKVQQQCRN